MPPALSPRLSERSGREGLFPAQPRRVQVTGDSRAEDENPASRSNTAKRSVNFF